LLNINTLYQNENLKIRVLRLAMQLSPTDLVCIDSQAFNEDEKYTADDMLAYLQINEDKVKKYI
jgi:hypothetical protein